MVNTGPVTSVSEPTDIVDPRPSEAKDDRADRMMPTDWKKQFGGAGVVASGRRSGGTTPFPARLPKRRRSRSAEKAKAATGGNGEYLAGGQRQRHQRS